MLNFIQENLGTIVVGALVLVALVLAILKIRRNRKSGSCSSGCPGCSGGCSHGTGCDADTKEK